MSHLAFAFGLLGNVVSFMVYLAPVPTFYQIHKKKSTQGFQSAPYIIGLFSSTLWIYYAFLKPDTTLLITINSVGCFIQTIYICLYVFYAPKKSRIETVRLLLLLNVIGFGLIILLTHFLVKKGSHQAIIIGWICLVFSLGVFVAPLFIVRQVIRTKSVEYMPFLLSFFLTLSAVMWFFYGLFRKDYNITIPNVLGFFFGVLQMALYAFYKNAKKVVEVKLPGIQNKLISLENQKLPELKDQIIDVVKLSAIMCSEIIPVVPQLLKNKSSNLEADKTEKNSVEM
ncbi:Bidirectional sugar transporter SWEET10 [Abeliophyllum distichum]|uniref:Bidirectional sugar transporter SWEET n=1 Tax=Abeliophyllum distichum TaxID=126358 RepID=A0ABD1PNK6_9LAMI